MSFRKPRISICVPSGITEVEKKAVEDAAYLAGAREVTIIEDPSRQPSEPAWIFPVPAEI